MRPRTWTVLFVVLLCALACDSKTEIIEPEGGRVIVSRVDVFPAAAVVELSQSRSFAANVTATVAGTVFWSVDGGAGNGTITQEGLYTAPLEPPVTTTVTVRATSIQDQTMSGSATVTVVDEGEGTLTVGVSPGVIDVELGKTHSFAASVAGIDTTVIWSVDGGLQYGAIDLEGLYTAPLWIPYPAEVTVRATSSVDSEIFDFATVTVIPAES